MSPRVHDCMAELVGGADLTQLSSSPELLFSQPSRRDGAFNASSGDTAAKPSANRPFPWHVDVPRLSNTGIVGVQVFTFLDTVKPGGGGAAVVTGSHRLLNNCGAVSIEGVNRHLDGERFFRDLFATRRAEGQQLFAANGRVRGVDLEVVELVGEPGDVYLMDLRALHTRQSEHPPHPTDDDHPTIHLGFRAWPDQASLLRTRLPMTSTGLNLVLALCLGSAVFEARLPANH